MKRLLFPLFFLCFGFIQAQNNPISNVNIRVSDERDMVTISYDLARNSRLPFYNITVNLSLGGKTIASPAGLSGDLGSQVTAGLGKKIIWDTRQDITSLEGELKIDVLTDSGTTVDGNMPCAPIKTIPVLAGLGGVAITGLGLMVSGLGQKGESTDLYDVYSSKTNPDDAVYTTFSRDEHYQDANSKHKNGSWLTLGGGAILAAGGAVLVSRLIKINTYNKRCTQGLTGNVPEPRLQLETATSGGPGVAVVYRF
jgi:hypothetical protein